MLQQIVMGPLSRTLGLIIIFAVFTLATGSVNGWYLLAEPAGVVNSERFDRVVVKGTNSPDAAWGAATAKVAHGGTAAAVIDTSYYMVGQSVTSDAAEITAITTANQVFYTPLGTEVTVGASTVGVISGSEYQEAGAIFARGGLSGPGQADPSGGGFGTAHRGAYWTGVVRQRVCDPAGCEPTDGSHYHGHRAPAGRDAAKRPHPVRQHRKRLYQRGHGTSCTTRGLGR